MNAETIEPAPTGININDIWSWLNPKSLVKASEAPVLERKISYNDMHI